jgi:septum formation topological specificity factor MinE
MEKILSLNILLLSLYLMACPVHAASHDDVVKKSDTLSVRVFLPLDEADVKNVEDFKTAVSELFEQKEAAGMELTKVIVSGSTSPDGDWEYNYRLSRRRADGAASYIIETMKLDISDVVIRYMNVDWRGLESHVQESDMALKSEVLSVLRKRDREERKAMLMQVDNGSVWKIMLGEYFPKLRYVSVELIGLVPVAYEEHNADVQADIIQKNASGDPVEETDSNRAAEPEQIVAEADEAWRFAVKTNVLKDAVAVPSFGMEFQLGNYLSFDVQGSVMAYNIFSSAYRKSHYYEVSPELRYWFGGNSMNHGHFLGVHGNYAIYSMQWLDGLVYQNGTSSIWDGILDEVMPVSPAWSAGLTYGYSFGFGERDQWGIEVFAGAGYLNTVQDVQSLSSNGNLEFKERQRKHGWGLTKVGVNLTYRFSIL